MFAVQNAKTCQAALWVRQAAYGYRGSSGASLLFVAQNAPQDVIQESMAHSKARTYASE